MRIRSGFVSNSSSSSFTVKDSDLDTTAKVALIMVAKIAEEREARDGVIDEKIEQAVDFLMENLDIDYPICFPWSTNYNTFIWRRSNGSIFVDTCNNNHWYDELDVEHFVDTMQLDIVDMRKERTSTLFFDLRSMKTVNDDVYRLPPITFVF